MRLAFCSDMNVLDMLNGPSELVTSHLRRDTPLKQGMRELEAAKLSVQGARNAYVEAIRREGNVLRSLVDRFGHGPFLHKGEMFTIVARKGPRGVTYFTRSINRS